MSSVNAKVVPFSEALTFTRASIKWVWDSTGTLVEVPVDQPAYDYDPVTGEPLGVLIEPAATNLLPNSNTFLATSSITVTASGLAPDGVSDAFEIVSTTDSDNAGYVHQGGYTTVNGQTDTYSVFIKSGTVSRAAIRLDRIGSDAREITVEIPNDGKFHRFDVNQTWTDSREVSCRVYPNSRVSKNIGDSVVVAFGQLEKGPVATSYIPTAGAAVTRAGDTLSRTLGAEFNPMAFSVVATAMTRDPRIGSSGAFAAAPNIFALYEDYNRCLYLNRRSGGGVNSRLQLGGRDTGDNALDIRLNIVGPAESFPANKWMRVGVSIDTTSSVLVSDGVSFGTSGGAIGLGTLSNFIVGRGINGYVKELHLYPYTMTEQELINLTS